MTSTSVPTSKPKLSRRDKKRGLVIVDVSGRRRLVIADMSDEEEELFSAKTREALNRNVRKRQCEEN